MEEQEPLTQASIMNDIGEDAYAPVDEAGQVIVETPETTEETTEEATNKETTETPKGTSEEISDEEAEAELADNPYKFDLKVDGEDASKEFTKEELIRLIQKSSAADKHLQDTGKATAKMNNLLEDLKDPAKTRRILTRLMGKEKVQELSQGVLSDQYDLSQMDDTTRALHEQNQKLLAEKEERDTELHETRTQQEQAEDNRYAEQLQGELLEIAPKYGLPAEERFVSLMADAIVLADDKDIELTNDQAAKLVRDNIQVDLMRFTKNEPVESLIGLLGKDVMKKINKYNLDSVKDIPGPPPSHYKNRGTSASNVEDKIVEANPSDVLQKIFLEHSDLIKR